MPSYCKWALVVAAILGIAAVGSPYFVTQTGLVIKHPITGVVTGHWNGTNGTMTAAHFIGDGSGITGLATIDTNNLGVSNIVASGTVSAAAFSGDGSGLTGVGSSSSIWTNHVGGGFLELLDGGSNTVSIINDDIGSNGRIIIRNGGSGENLTGTRNAYLFGFQSGDAAEIANSVDVMGLGTLTLSDTAMDTVSDIIAIGDQALYTSYMTNSSSIIAIGRNAFGGSAVKPVNHVSNITSIGDGSLATSELTDSSYMVILGDSVGSSSTMTNASDIIAIGDNSLGSSVLSDSQDIIAIGQNTLASSQLSNTKKMVCIGNSVGQSLTGEYTNVVLIGNGATIGPTGKDQIITGTDMSLWVGKDCSALTFTDRSRSPTNTAEAYAIVASHKAKDGKVDHSALHKSAWGSSSDGKPDQSSRDLSMVVSAQQMVIQDLISRIDKLEKK